MKFSLLSYGIPKKWPLEKLIGEATRLGYSGIELRCEWEQGHGVELELSAQQRRDVRYRVQDAYLEIAGLGCSSRFHYTDTKIRSENVDRAKRYIDLAADVGALALRVCGNEFPANVERRECIRYVAESLGEIADHAAPAGINVLLEMHGEFNNWHFCLGAMKHAGRTNLGLLLNSDDRDLVDGSIASTFSRIRPHLKHVHLHDLTSGYPYDELFALLAASGYDGYISPEISNAEPSPEDYLALYTTHIKTLRKAGA